MTSVSTTNSVDIASNSILFVKITLSKIKSSQSKNRKQETNINSQIFPSHLSVLATKANVPRKREVPGPGKRKSGLSFFSVPLEQDIEFAGHFSARLEVSLSLPDADVVQYPQTYHKRLPSSKPSETRLDKNSS